MASRDTPRGVSPVLRGVCANLLWKRSKAALSYSTPFPMPISTAIIGSQNTMEWAVCPDFYNIFEGA